MRIFHLLNGLTCQHDVTFVTYGTDEDRRLLMDEFGERISKIIVVNHRSLYHKYPWLVLLYALWKRQGYLSASVRNVQMQKTINQLLNAEKYDAVLMEFPVMGQLQLPDHLIKILDEHNVEYYNLHRMYKRTQFSVRKFFFLRERNKMFLQEINTCNRFDAIFVTSHKDREILQDQVDQKPLCVIPNGVDTTYFTPSGEKTEPYSMIFTGTMEYTPNRDAMVYFLDEIFPVVKRKIPEAKIYIVGKNPPRTLKRRAADDVIVTGYVDDVRPYASKAGVYVVPLRMGSGTRLKILEGLAMRKAIVTTTIGCEGLDVVDGEHVAIADDPARFAEKVIELLVNTQKNKKLADNGYKKVRSKYDWDVITSTMNEALDSIFNEKFSSV